MQMQSVKSHTGNDSNQMIMYDVPFVSTDGTSNMSKKYCCCQQTLYKRQHVQSLRQNLLVAPIHYCQLASSHQTLLPPFFTIALLFIQ